MASDKGVVMGYSNKVTGNCVTHCLYLSFIVLFTLFLLFSSTPALSGTIDLPQTGQTTCYNTAGTPIACDDTGQDGDFLAGVAWPVPRFEVDKTLACITDNLTGLMWSLNAYTSDVTWAAWNDAVSFPPNLNTLCGYNDWRLPNVNELQSLINAEQADNTLWLKEQGFRFRTDISPIYWSSTSSADSPFPFVNAWDVSMIDGSIISESKGFTRLIWPVRGTSNPSTGLPPGQIAETGQITSVANYDDAYFVITPGLNVGVPWPDPRFEVIYCDSTGRCADQDTDCDANHVNDIVTDNLTGLAWSADANLDGLKTWGSALSFANGLTTCGYGDWRLPNSKELFSLIDRSQSNPALPAGHPFANVQSGVGDLYWSSTSYASDPDPDRAWTTDMLLGNLTPLLKTETAFVWTVRGGQTKPYVLIVKKEGTGRGNVTADGLTCVGKTCTGEYASYDEVIVTATEQTGSVFTEWTDCPTPSGNTCTITITDDITIKATFLPEYKISVVPKSLNFKNLKQNIESAPLSVTITNVGVANLDLSTPAVIAEDPTSVFAIFSNDCPAALSSDASCTIAVTATSPDYDTKTAELQISSNDPKKPLTIVRLKARAKPPKITRKPGSLNFGKVTVGVPFDKTLTITNKGITDLVIGLITTSGDHPGDFSTLTADTCSGSTLVTDGTCTLTVTFTPSVVGKRSAILQIPSNDPKRLTLSVKLKGVGQ
jgi:hypothetical protein